MDKEEHERNLYSFLQVYLVLGFAFLGFLFCFVTGFSYDIGETWKVYIFIFFVFQVPSSIQGLIHKINNFDPLSLTEADQNDVYIKKDYSHSIYFYIDLCMNIAISTGFGVLMASVLLYLKD